MKFANITSITIGYLFSFSTLSFCQNAILNVVDKTIILLNRDHNITVFNRDFMECTNDKDPKVIQKIIQTKLNYNLDAGARKDSAAFWSIFTDNFSYKEYDGEIVSRKEAEAQFKNSRRGLIAVSPKTFVKIDSLFVHGDTAIVYTNQHYVRTEWGNDGKTHEYISNVTHKETWVRQSEDWKSAYLEELTEGPYTVDGKPDFIDIKGHYNVRTYWENGIDAFEKKFFQERKSHPNEKFVEEATLNSLGYKLLYGKNKVNEAIRIFKVNTLAYPNSFNVYDSYAEALMVNNQKQEAIANYRKSLKLFPNSGNAMDMLSRLGAPIHLDTLALWLKTLVPQNIEYLPNVVYGKGGGRDLRMHILKPKQNSSFDLPVIVFVHGGGWTEGSKERGVVPLLHFAQKGYLCVSVEYRLTKEAIFPSQIQDVKCAIRYLRANASKYNIDVNKIGVWGQSAGGFLAILAGTSANVKEFEGQGGWNNYSSEVNAICDWNGPTDFLADTSAIKLRKPEESAINRLLGGPLVDNQDKASMANPIRYVSKVTPPFLIIHGLNDGVVSIRQSQLLYDQLKQYGIPVEFIKLKEEGHFGVYNLQPGQISDGNSSNSEIIITAMDRFFDTFLKNKKDN